MSRDWLAIYSAIVTKPKYRNLSPVGRGALLHTLVLAGYQDPEATWDDPEELREALRLDGFPAGALDELIGLRWLDLEDGVLSVHGWDKHQLAASAAIGRAWEAASKKRWRRQKKSEEATDKTGQDITRHNKGPDMSGHVPTPDRSLKKPNGLHDGSHPATCLVCHPRVSPYKEVQI